MVFKVGDKVKHILGGGEMVVIDVRSDGSYRVLCRRYNEKKDDFETKSFKEEELDLVKRKGGEHLT